MTVVVRSSLRSLASGSCLLTPAVADLPSPPVPSRSRLSTVDTDPSYTVGFGMESRSECGLVGSCLTNVAVGSFFGGGNSGIEGSRFCWG